MMDFEIAKEYIMPFGDYKGSTLDSIASSDEGLLYLDWMRDNNITEPLKTPLNIYLDDPSIQKELEKLT